MNVGGRLDVILRYCRLPTMRRYIVKLKLNILYSLLSHFNSTTSCWLLNDNDYFINCLFSVCYDVHIFLFWIMLTFRGICICFAVQYHCFYNLISLLLLGIKVMRRKRRECSWEKERKNVKVVGQKIDIL